MRVNGDKIVNRNKPKYKKVKTENALEMQPRKTNSHIRRFAKTSSILVLFCIEKQQKAPNSNLLNASDITSKKRGKKKNAYVTDNVLTNSFLIRSL